MRERRTVLKSFIKEILKDRDHAIIRYRIPVPSQQSGDQETVLDLAQEGGAGGTLTLDFPDIIGTLLRASNKTGFGIPATKKGKTRVPKRGFL